LPGIARLLATLKAVAFVTYKEWAAYRSHMLLSLLVGPAFFLAQSFIWKAVYTGHGSLGGFNLQGMLAYYGVSTIIYFLRRKLSANSIWTFRRKCHNDFRGSFLWRSPEAA